MLYLYSYITYNNLKQLQSVQIPQFGWDHLAFTLKILHPDTFIQNPDLNPTQINPILWNNVSLTEPFPSLLHAEGFFIKETLPMYPLSMYPLSMYPLSMHPLPMHPSNDSR